MTGLEIKGRLDRIGKTPLEHFKDIEELEVVDGPEITVKDLLPYKCEQVEKSLKALEVIKEKRVACDLLTNPDVRDYKKYNSHCDKYDFIVPLTEEEFNTLKEVLE